MLLNNTTAEETNTRVSCATRDNTQRVFKRKKVGGNRKSSLFEEEEEAEKNREDLQRKLAGVVVPLVSNLSEEARGEGINNRRRVAEQVAGRFLRTTTRVDSGNRSVEGSRLEQV